MNPYAPPTAPLAPPAGPMTPGASGPRPINVMEAIRFPFQSPDWKTNLLMGAVLMLIPIAGPIAFSGWMCEAHQRLVRRHPEPLPKFDFSDFTHYLTRGVMPFLVNLVLMFPMLLVFYAMVAGVTFGAFAAGAATEEPLAAIGVGAVGGLVSLLVLIGITAVVNAGNTRAELTEDFGRSVSFGPLLDYTRSTFSRFLVKQILFGFVSFGVVLLGMLACYIGLYPAILVIQLAAMHLRFQLYDDHVGRGGEPIELKPPQWLPSEAARMGQQGMPMGRV